MSLLRNRTHLNISTRALVEGLRGVTASTGLMGRWHKLHDAPLAVCDTGHNAHGIRLVVEDLRRMRKNDARLICVVGFSADKDLNAILAVLPREAYYIFTQAESHRAALAEDVKQRAVAVGLNGEVVANVKEALAKARAMASPEDVIFVGGSNYVVAEIL